MSLDLQALICLSSCPSIYTPRPWEMLLLSWFPHPSSLLAPLIFVRCFAFKADFKSRGSHSKLFIPLLIAARAPVEFE